MIWYKVKKYSLDVSISGLCGLERVKGKITYTKRKCLWQDVLQYHLLNK